MDTMLNLDEVCPMLQLRPYQQEALDKVQENWDEGKKRVVLQLPTGGGKTEIAAQVIINWRQENPNQDIIFLVHRTDLVNQTAERFAGYGIPVIKGSGNEGKWGSGRPRPSGNLVMCVQTLSQRFKVDPSVVTNARLIVDEMHWYPDISSGKSSWGELVAASNDLVLGLSATPWRMGLEEKFAPTWEVMVKGPQTHELIDEGFLADYIVKDVEASIRRIELKGKMRIASSQDSIDTAATWNYYKDDSRGTLTSEAVAIWLAEAADRPTIVFALTTDHAWALKEVFNGFRNVLKAWYPDMDDNESVAEVIIGSTPEGERKSILKRFASGKLRVLIGVDVMREGFDAPDASCLLNLRPTDSMALWRQMCGRVLRPKPEKALILDFARNYAKLGFPDDQYDWSLASRYITNGVQSVPYKICKNVGGNPECKVVNSIPVHFCKDCGAPFGKVCEASDNGCGEWRPWSLWNGSRKYKPNCCDRCEVESAHFHTELNRKRQEEEARKANEKATWGLRNKRDFVLPKIVGSKAESFRERLVEENETAKLENAMFQEYLDNPDALLWTPAKSGYGIVLEMALARAWVGGSSNTGYTWKIYTNNQTPKDLEKRIIKWNRMSDRFSTLEEAKADFEEVFEDFRNSTLVGIRCHCLAEYYPEGGVAPCSPNFNPFQEVKTNLEIDQEVERTLDFVGVR